MCTQEQLYIVFFYEPIILDLLVKQSEIFIFTTRSSQVLQRPALEKYYKWKT